MKKVTFQRQRYQGEYRVVIDGRESQHFVSRSFSGGWTAFGQTFRYIADAKGFCETYVQDRDVDMRAERHVSSACIANCAHATSN